VRAGGCNGGDSWVRDIGVMKDLGSCQDSSWPERKLMDGYG